MKGNPLLWISMICVGCYSTRHTSEINNDACDPLLDCSSTDGSFVCGPCPSDYSPSDNSGDDYLGCLPASIQQLGSSRDDAVEGIAVDEHGSAYVAGVTNGDLDGNTNAGEYDVFLVKYDSQGDRQWTRQIGTSGLDYGGDVATDSSGNAYVTGTTDGNLDGNTNAGESDMFLVKYNSEGDKQWTRQLGTPSHDESSGVATDNDGNVYVTGTTYGRLDENRVTFDDNIFVVKYDSQGEMQWVRQIGTLEFDQGSDVASDSSGNVYLTGVVSGDLGGHVGDHDIVIVKYTDQGVLQWIRQFGSPRRDNSRGGIAIDSSGNVYIAGATDIGGNYFDTEYHRLVLKYSSEGERQWKHVLDTTGFGASGIAVDSAGYVYVTGSATGIVDENVDADNRDLYIIKYDSEGVEQWTHQRSTTQSDSGAAIAIDGSDAIFVAGGNSGGINETEQGGMCDIFVVKYDSAGNPL